VPRSHNNTSSNALGSPASLGYRMPAEWEPHAATWLAWPHYHGDWPGKFEPIPWVYAEIIRHLAKHERVELIVNDAVSERRARKILDRANALSSNIRFHRWATNRVWLRDSGCIFVKSGRVRSGLGPRHAERSSALLALKFRFNAWAKYSNWKLDDKIGSLMAKVNFPARSRQVRRGRGNLADPMGQPAIPTLRKSRGVGRPDAEDLLGEVHPVSADKRIVLEGGSIDVNGAGTILTTEECLLSKLQQRNPHMSRIHYDKAFADYLGAPHTIWLGRGIVGDDTHGHVDDLARFVAKDTVVTMVEPNAHDPNHAPLRANLRRLQSSHDQDGKQLTVVEIPMPQPVIFEGRRLPASYANFYIANGVVLVPVFNRANDRVAMNTLSELFPSREIIPIYSGDFIWGFGAMHCMTQQQPA
jgi:agmatine deiminase